MNLHFLIEGFGNALSVSNLIFALLGSIMGTLVGVLPGIGPTAGIAMLLPVTTLLPPAPAMIMWAAIYYGAAYGGSTTAILLNIPGEIGSVVTCIDGYEMAKQGRAREALAISAISSFIAGTLGIVGLTFLAPPLANMALCMGPPEIFGLTVFAFSMVASLSGKSLLKGFISAGIGMFICLVGLDPTLGIERLTFGSVELTGGFDFIAIIMGLFAVKEVFENVGVDIQAISDTYLGKWWRMITWREVTQSFPAIIRSTIVGFFLGCLPGCTPGVISFLSYDVEKKLSKNRAMFGKGAIAGVAAPEGANNSASSGGFVPLLTLGIPSSTALAVLLSGLMMYGLQPGPLLFEKQPVFVWTVIASMYIGNVMLLILNLPLVGVWAKMITVPYRFIAPLILLFCFIGTYIRNRFFDVATCLAFGLIGLIMERAKLPTIPLVLAIILTPMMEDSIRQTISMGHGSLAVVFDRPIAMILIGLSLMALCLTIRIQFKSKASRAMPNGQ